MGTITLQNSALWSLQPRVLDFLVRILFFRHLTREQVITEFQKETCSLQEQIDDLAAMEETLKKNSSSGLNSSADSIIPIF
jgi:hypothetical protein